MAPRPTWQGHLKLSLLSCPVVLYAAADQIGGTGFNRPFQTAGGLVHAAAADPEAGLADLVEGLGFENGRYLVAAPGEIGRRALESGRTIEIDRFVEEDAVDRLRWSEPGYLAPDGRTAVEAYAVIREAMSRAGVVALGRVVLRRRERLLAIEPRGAGMVAWSLRDEAARDPMEALRGDLREGWRAPAAARARAAPPPKPPPRGKVVPGRRP